MVSLSELEAALSASSSDPPIVIGIIIGMVLGLIIGFAMGFLVATRGKQISSLVKLIPASLRSLFKAADEDKDDGQAEDQVDAEDEGADDLQNLDNFLNSDHLPGLDDHADIEFNPIIMYKIKIAKEEQRKEKARAQLISDGYDPDDMEEADANALAGAGDGKPTALAIMVAAGARVTPMAASNSAEALAREDRRRQVRSIDTYLNRYMDVDVTRVQKKTEGHAGGAKKKKQSALDVANTVGSGTRPEDAVKRLALQSARWSRTQLREIHRVKPILFKPSGSNPIDEDAKVRRRTGKALTSEDQADILKGLAELDQLELEDDEAGEGEEDEEGEEGDQGEEGAGEDESDLAA